MPSDKSTIGTTYGLTNVIPALQCFPLRVFGHRGPVCLDRYASIRVYGMHKADQS